MDFLRIFRSTTPETLLGGRYNVIGQLGAGGFGETFLAEDLHLPGNARCVIKRLKPQFTDAFNLQTAKRLFDTEAQVLYQLGNHDQIPRLLAHFEHKQEFYLAQELIVGDPLTEELVNGQPWLEGQVFALLKDILNVLVFVHQQNVIHRDIKPANLIRRRHDGRVVLIDFGAVKQATTQLVNPNSGPTYTIAIGTQGYMPNEQIGGNPRFSSDVYAVGMVAIQAATGTSPKLLHEDPKTGEIQWRHLAAHISPELADVLDKMIRYDFRMRYPSAAEALEAVSSLPIIPVEKQPESHSTPVSEADPASGRSAQSNSVSPTESFSSEPTAPWTPPLTGSSAPSANSQSGNSHAPTEALIPPQQPQSSVPVTSSPASLTPVLASLKRPEIRKLLMPVSGLAAIALLLIVFKPFKPADSTSPTASPPAATSAASSTPSPQAPEAQATALLTQANDLREKEQLQDALKLYDQAIALNTNSPEAYWGRCYSLNALARANEAISACDAALTLNPNYPEALWSKGFALDQQKKHQEALKLYEQALSLRPDFAEAWSNKGTALLLLKRPNDAVQAFDQATRLNPNLAEAWNNRGAALWSLNRFDEAIASVEKALQVQPDYQDAVKLRQQMRQKLGR